MPWKGRELGISRQVGYDWVRRYRDADFKPAALKERSRRPHTTPSKVDESMESVIVETRKSRPTWGPKKIRAQLLEQFPMLSDIPAASTIGEVLHRRGFVTRSRSSMHTHAF